MATAAPFDPALVGIERKRFSVTQGEVLLTYAGRRIDQYGDAIALRDGEWRGYSDEFLINVAKREVIERGWATEPTPPAPAAPALTGFETADELLWLGFAVAHVALYYEQKRMARKLRDAQVALRYRREFA